MVILKKPVTVDYILYYSDLYYIHVLLYCQFGYRVTVVN